MKALVTGGGGFLGLAVTRLLLQHGWAVRSFSRQEYSTLEELGVEQHRGDLADSAAVTAAAAGCDIVFHVAAKAGIWGPYETYHRTNVLGTANIIEACRRGRISRLVYTSSPSVVFDGTDMEGVDESVPYPTHYEAYYPQTKAMAEQLVKQANGPKLATVSLRPHLIWGPGDNHLLPRLMARAKAGQLYRIGRAQKLVDTVYIDNAAEAHWLAAERLTPGSRIAGKAYFISQGQPIETWTIINRLLEAAGAPQVRRSIPAFAARTLAGLFESFARWTHSSTEPRLTRFVVRELTTAHWFDITAAREDLGYEPTVSIDEGLRRLQAQCCGADATTT
jgi:nucleoside-diphosphate-sugar epimerase